MTAKIPRSGMRSTGFKELSSEANARKEKHRTRQVKRLSRIGATLERGRAALTVQDAMAEHHDVDLYDFDLPAHRIAARPAPERTAVAADAPASRPRCATPAPSHHRFSDLVRLLRPGDLLVANDTRVMACRLVGNVDATGGAVELLVLDPGPGPVRALARPAKQAARRER